MNIVHVSRLTTDSRPKHRLSRQREGKHRRCLEAKTQLHLRAEGRKSHRRHPHWPRSEPRYCDKPGLRAATVAISSGKAHASDQCGGEDHVACGSRLCFEVRRSGPVLTLLAADWHVLTILGGRFAAEGDCELEGAAPWRGSNFFSIPPPRRPAVTDEWSRQMDWTRVGATQFRELTRPATLDLSAPPSISQSQVPSPLSSPFLPSFLLFIIIILNLHIRPLTHQRSQPPQISHHVFVCPLRDSQDRK